MLHLDHLVFAVNDLDEAGERFRASYGLASVEGGEHAGVGTANRIVPLGDSYIELMAIVDESAAAENPVGRYLKTFLAGGERPMLWCVATDDIKQRSKWIGAPVMPWSRRLPDGREIAWRLSGIDGALADRSLPFFIEWDCPPEDHPSRERVAHDREPLGIASLEVGGLPKKIDNRLGGWHEPHGLPITVVKGGDLGPRCVTVATTTGDVVIT
jgi:hypothetical protein